MAFYPQTNSQTKRQNSIMEAYLRAFINWEQNDWARFLAMAEFTYNNANNASIGHTSFEFNCGFHPQISFKDNINLYLKSRFADKLANKLRELINICQQNLLYT